MKSRSLLCCLTLAAVLFPTAAAQAVSIDVVTVGNPGNPPDTRYNAISVGSVPYTYQIGKFEVTAGQYAAFLNAVAATDTYGLYNTLMDNAVFFSGCNIKQSGSPGSYTYYVPNDAVAGYWANRPVNFVSWLDAARFANWLSNGQPTGGQNISTTEDGSYFLNGATDLWAPVTRKPNATWVIPSEDEWYKAAYYDPNKPGGAGYWDYPTKSDQPPISEPPPGHAEPPGSANSGNVIGFPYFRTELGAYLFSPAPYGTFDQGGNVWEWNEANYPSCFIRGGSFDLGPDPLHASARQWWSPANDKDALGFRVAFVPEPSGLMMLLGGAVMALLYWWRRHV